jgi:hypothetical protein
MHAGERGIAMNPEERLLMSLFELRKNEAYI